MTFCLYLSNSGGWPELILRDCRDIESAVRACAQYGYAREHISINADERNRRWVLIPKPF